jgi:DNA primase
MNVSDLKQRVSPQLFFERELGSFDRAASRDWVIGGLCPFHSDNRPGSFRVNQRTGAFKCFSCGTGGGDVISFLQLRYNLSFPQALARLQDEHC